VTGNIVFLQRALFEGVSLRRSGLDTPTVTISKIEEHIISLENNKSKNNNNNIIIIFL